MKRVVLVASIAALLTSCKLELEQTPRAYACARGEADQCSAGWVCGVDGFCHAPYADTWLCDRDAGDSDCFGWRCGLEGRCHPRTGSAWLCEPDAGDDCFDWHCGLSGVCYPLDAGEARPCDHAREVAGTRDDCPSGWRCGLENVCHAEGAPAAYQCTADSDCESGFRCGPDHLCLDSSGERPMFPSAPAPVVTRVHPQLWDSKPEAISTETIDGGRTVAWLTGGTQLHHANVDPFGRRSDGTLPTWPAPLVVTLPGTPSSIAEVAGRTFAAVGSEVLIYDWVDAGSIVRRVDAGVMTLVSIREENAPRVALAFGGRRVALIDRNGNMSQFIVDAGTVSGASVVYSSLVSGLIVVAAAPPDRALAVVLDADGGFGATSYFPPAPFAAGFAPHQIAAWGPDFAFVSDAGVATAQLSLAPSFNIGPLCRPCLAGEALIGITTFTGSGLVAICRGPTGVTDVFVDPACVRGQVTASDPTVLESSSMPMSLARAHGQLEAGEPPAQYQPIFATGGTQEVMRSYSASGLVAAQGAVVQLGNIRFHETPVGLVRGVGFSAVIGPSFRGLSGFGMVGSSFSLSAYDLSGWAASPALDLPAPIALIPFGGFPVSNAATFTGAGGLDSTGATLLALQGGGHVFTARVVPDGGAVTFADRAVPLAGVNIDSMVAVKSPADAGLIDLYALGSSGLARVRGLGERAWQTVLVSVPLGEWVKVLGEDDRARLAYQDGREVLLPTGVYTSEPLPPSAAPLDFETLGHADFAITSDGLYVTAANPDGGVLAVWKSVALPASSTDPNARPEFSAGRFFWGAGRLYLMTRWGTTYRIELP